GGRLSGAGPRGPAGRFGRCRMAELVSVFPVGGLAPGQAGAARSDRSGAGEPERRLRQERMGLAFGLSGAAWNEELVLERYELLYEAGLVVEAVRSLG